MIPINMPQVGQDIPAGTIVQWLKKENDSVEKGEVVLTVESEKAVFDVEAEESGVLLKILHDEGAEVEILKPVGYIGQPGDVPEEPGRETEAVEPVKAQSGEEVKPEKNNQSGKIFISPAARRRAREDNIDISEIKGSGPDNRIIARDVSVIIDSSSQTEQVSQGLEEDTVIAFGKMRKVIAKRLTMSKQTIPHFYVSVDVDVTDLFKWRKRVNSEGELKITITDLIIKAAATALSEYRGLNAHVDATKTILRKDINIGVAVAAEDGLLVPVVSGADRKNLREISEISKSNAEAARKGSVNNKNNGTFTITSLGMYSVKDFLPIINPPECGILAVSTAQKRVVALADDTIGIRSVMSLTLACDHRAVDGVYASKFLNNVKDYLENLDMLKGQKR